MKNETDSRRVRLVWMVTREYEGLAGAGGVKDVCRQLAEALVVHGNCKVRVLLPRYGFIDPVELGFTPVALEGGRAGKIGGRYHEQMFEVDMNYAAEERRESVAIWEMNVNGVSVCLVEAERYGTKRGVYTYTVEDEKEHSWQRRGTGHIDYFAMNILLQKASLDLMLLLDEHPDIIHCQDGHAATLPAMARENCGYRHFFRRSGLVVTIHNAGLGYHQEVDDLSFAEAVTGLPQRVILTNRLGRSFNPFVAAARYAILNTVSENYGRELQETVEDARTGWLGHALKEMGVELAGITNGIDPHSFDPLLPQTLGLDAPFDPRQGDFAGKAECRASMLRDISRHRQWENAQQFGALPERLEGPLFTFIGRLTAQKGVDFLLQAVMRLSEYQRQPSLLVLGSGAPEFEKQLERMAQRGMGEMHICFLKGYDPQLANRVYAAGDFFLIPSRYEPCGLTDYIAQLLGNLPIVHRVGGLVKVIDGVTGITYEDNSAEALADAMLRAEALYRDEPEAIRSMQQAAVERIDRYHTWERVMEDYFRLYGQALELAGQER